MPAKIPTPTPEQEEALRLFSTGRSLAIEAGAGAGKTSTLVLLASSTDRRGAYIAFNKAIVTESGEKFPANVACSTAHSLAYRAVVPGTRYAERLRSSSRMKSMEIARILGITEPIYLDRQDGERKRLSPSRLAGIAMRGVIGFCQSADREPNETHVPYIDGLDVPPGRSDNNRLVARALVPAMRRAWADIVNERGVLPFRHDHYLKIWHLSGPKINADFILFDEAQDANPVLVDIVRQQTAQLVWVGDSQQQIYSFTGAVNALQTVGAEQRAFLTRSFRFGPEIAAVANRCLDGLDAELRIEGAGRPGVVERGGRPDAILCRTNATAVRSFLDELGNGGRPNLVGGGREVLDFAKAARDLQTDGWTSHPELACFGSWDEVVEYVAMDEQGGDLRLLVKLIDEFGIETIVSALERMPREADATVVISTAHKAKGREWDAVRLADDFPAAPRDEELRLLYVAVTRARLRLDVSAIEYLRGAPFAAPVERIVSAIETLGVAVVSDPAVEPGLAHLTKDDEILATIVFDQERCDDPAHDFASCSACNAAAREAEHGAEAACDAPVAGGAGGREQGRDEAGDGSSSWTIYIGRGRSFSISPTIAVAHARDIHVRTGKHVCVLDERGELVVDYDR